MSACLNVSCAETLEKKREGPLKIMESKNLSVKYAELFVNQKYKNTLAICL